MPDFISFRAVQGKFVGQTKELKSTNPINLIEPKTFIMFLNLKDHFQSQVGTRKDETLLRVGYNWGG